MSARLWSAWVRVGPVRLSLFLPSLILFHH